MNPFVQLLHTGLTGAGPLPACLCACGAIHGANFCAAHPLNPTARPACRLRQAHLQVGRPCAACPRGALASKPLLGGDVVARVPINSTIPLHGDSGIESGMELLGKMHGDPVFNVTFGPWLAALPGPDDLLVPLLYTAGHIDMLQSSELVGGACVCVILPAHGLACGCLALGRCCH